MRGGSWVTARYGRVVREAGEVSNDGRVMRSNRHGWGGDTAQTGGRQAGRILCTAGYDAAGADATGAMASESVAARKALAAWAGEGLVARVDALVPSQVVLADEGGTAASSRRSASVGVSRRRERSDAPVIVRAHERFVFEVRLDVRLDGALARE